MNELEDEPKDVQNARPVEEEVRKGMIDEIRVNNLKSKSEVLRSLNENRDDDSSEDRYPCRKKSLPKCPSPFICRKPKPAIKKDCCAKKKRKIKKAMTVYVHGKPCNLEKEPLIPRKCLTPDEYLNMLAKPKKYCPNECAKKPELRKFKAIPPRILELARPAKRHIVGTMQLYGADLAPQQLENLMEALEEANLMTPEQAEEFLQGKRDCAKKKAEEKRRRKRERKKCFPKPEKKCCDSGDPCLDTEAVNCMYSMALRFVRAILNWKCCIPHEQYKDIAAVILRRLAKVLCYEPIGNEDKKSQQMRLLADLIACWISDVLMEVAEKNKDALMEECMRKREEMEELRGLEDIISDGDSDYVDMDDYDKSTTVETSADLGKSLGIVESDEEEWQDYDEDDGDYTSSVGVGTLGVLTESVAVGEDDDGESIEIVGADDGTDQQIQTDVGEDKAVVTDRTADELEMDRLAKSCSRLFNTDVPFLTFARILEVLFCLIDCVSESTLQCPLDNRIHRAIYVKLEEVARMENPKQLTKKVQDVIDVVAGKLAKFVRKSLQDAEVAFLENNPPQVESKELRDWTKRLTEMTNVVEDWSGWLEKVVCEACKLRAKKKVTRGEWWEWTSKFEANAMLWRRTYLEAVHDEHHDLMMVCGREVVKTGDKRKLPCHGSEVVMNKTSFTSCRRFVDTESRSQIECLRNQIESRSLRSQDESNTRSYSLDIVPGSSEK